jgi:FtsZ-binding cell division protein ZapB
MLEAMMAKGKAAKQDEEVKFAAFTEWCGNTRKKKEAEVKAGTDLMGKLDAKIQKAAVHISGLQARVAELEEDIGRWKQDQGSASTVREREKADYTATATDYQESIDAVAGAIAVLQKQAYDRPQSDLLQQAFVQIQRRQLVPSHAKRALAAFLQQRQDPQLSYEAPEANAYESQTGGVIDMLEKLKDEFGTKKRELDKEELQAQQAYEAIIQQLSDNIENAEAEASRKTTGKTQTAQLKAEAEGDLASATKERDEDQIYLDDTNSLCATKSQDYERRQNVRASELEALGKAVEIIGGQAVKGSGDKHLHGFLQIRQQVSALAQLRKGPYSDVQDRVAVYLTQRAKATDSRLLMLVSEKVVADPFTKVKKMVKDLIVKLMEESTAETEHNGWCQTELATNKHTRETKSTEADKLTATIEDLTATIASLANDIASLTKEIEELNTSMAKTTADRGASKEDNTSTIKDAKAGQVAVTQAISVLKDFYAKSGDSAALTQVGQSGPADDAPETFDAEYKGQLPEGGSIVDFLEVILSDFARLEAETDTAETAEEEDYEKFMFESKRELALKENDKAHKGETKVDKESELHSTEGDLKVTQEQLEKAMAYYEKLKPTCVDSGITYEERVKRREEEIQSLQEALKILSGTDIA